ncbi:ead/Ea22-like family protein [Salmonella enterica subsp. diarizonae]|uniref:Ead/Ea22-like family protein n=1 Tax=Salmonella diarizonae TaxID=59204 RepID=A0A6Y1QRH7_SALDZ|nr:ead/Ea22-like family protein [Salmonella enterica subsp. enterica serovar Newport]ECC9428006.1 ead/Ea22-like family protein [Salmonella enterica subsp. diarizonae]ECI5695772.1 ead/Ea22-like family protein [Salmonella enterica subsp. diarizonae]EHN5370700.1 ead/Ea22-like family protein [Salmonella enterica subsp. enterica serovar Newport]HAB3965435.1 ead/Ea22-like family protein [Salmonella enterica subsp. diarizonae]
MTIDKQALRERYSPKPAPECHICGAEMTIQRMSAGRITYGCTGSTYDDKGCHYAEGRSIADDHYEQSRVTVVDVSDPDVLALLDELESKQTFQQAFFRQSLMYDVVAEAYEEAKEQIAKDVEIKTRLCLESNSLFDRLRAAEKHIAELEARTVTLPDRKSEIFWPGDAYEFDSLGYVIAVKSAIHAAGIQIIEEGKTDGQ